MIEKSSKTIYETLGGEKAFETAVEIFYGKVLSDDLLKEYFAETNMTQQKKHQKNFLIFACGGPNNYVGRDMRSAHLKFNLNDQHFDAVVGHLAATLKELGVPDEIIGQIAAKVEPLRKEILNQ